LLLWLLPSPATTTFASVSMYLEAVFMQPLTKHVSVVCVLQIIERSAVGIVERVEHFRMLLNSCFVPTCLHLSLNRCHPSFGLDIKIGSIQHDIVGDIGGHRQALCILIFTLDYVKSGGTPFADFGV
jgi:hypothetical protein